MATITYTVTVANPGSGNVYYIDGSPNPTLSFSKGNTYVFDLSDSSNSGHPLRFKDGAGSSYSTGVTVTNTPGTAGAKVEIVVGAATPSSLRYYCTVHGDSMGNTITVAFDVAYSALYGSGEYGKALYGIASGVAVLSGVSAAGSIAPVQITGFEIDLEENLDSVTATISVGTIKPNLTISILGVSATGQQNSIVISRAKTLTGVSLTGSIGSLALSNTTTLSGVQATGTADSLEEVFVVEKLTGVQGTTAVNLPAPSNAITAFDPDNFSRARAIRLVEVQSSRRAA